MGCPDSLRGIFLALPYFIKILVGRNEKIGLIISRVVCILNKKTCFCHFHIFLLKTDNDVEIEFVKIVDSKSNEFNFGALKNLPTDSTLIKFLCILNESIDRKAEIN